MALLICAVADFSVLTDVRRGTSAEEFTFVSSDSTPTGVVHPASKGRSCRQEGLLLFVL